MGLNPQWSVHADSGHFKTNEGQKAKFWEKRRLGRWEWARTKLQGFSGTLGIRQHEKGGTFIEVPQIGIHVRRADIGAKGGVGFGLGSEKWSRSTAWERGRRVQGARIRKSKKFGGKVPTKTRERLKEGLRL